MGEAIKPDEVIAPEKGFSLQARQTVKDAALMLPNLIKLLGRLLKDPRVSRRSKLVVLGAVGYALSPIDIIPDFLPVAGQVDDVLLVVFAVNHLIHAAGEKIVLEHWEGPQDLLGIVRGLMDVVSDLVPSRIRKLVSKLSGS